MAQGDRHFHWKVPPASDWPLNRAAGCADWQIVHVWEDFAQRPQGTQSIEMNVSEGEPISLFAGFASFARGILKFLVAAFNPRYAFA